MYTFNLFVSLNLSSENSPDVYRYSIVKKDSQSPEKPRIGDYISFIVPIGNGENLVLSTTVEHIQNDSFSELGLLGKHPAVYCSDISCKDLISSTMYKISLLIRRDRTILIQWEKSHLLSVDDDDKKIHPPRIL